MVSFIPNNLKLFVFQMAVAIRSKESIFGGDYSTPDGTGVRDYIRVLKSAAGNLAAINSCSTKKGGM